MKFRSLRSLLTAGLIALVLVASLLAIHGRADADTTPVNPWTSIVGQVDGWFEIQGVMYPKMYSWTRDPGYICGAKMGDYSANTLNPQIKPDGYGLECRGGVDFGRYAILKPCKGQLWPGCEAPPITGTPVPPTVTETATPTETPVPSTATPTTAPSPTPGETPQTATPVPPTATTVPSPTPGETPQQTATPTTAPSPTPGETPQTATPVPPTATTAPSPTPGETPQQTATPTASAQPPAPQPSPTGKTEKPGPPKYNIFGCGQPNADVAHPTYIVRGTWVEGGHFHSEWKPIGANGTFGFSGVPAGSPLGLELSTVEGGTPFVSFYIEEGLQAFPNDRNEWSIDGIAKQLEAADRIRGVDTHRAIIEAARAWQSYCAAPPAATPKQPEPTATVRAYPTPNALPVTGSDGGEGSSAVLGWLFAGGVFTLGGLTWRRKASQKA